MKFYGNTTGKLVALYTLLRITELFGSVAFPNNARF